MRRLSLAFMLVILNSMPNPLLSDDLESNSSPSYEEMLVSPTPLKYEDTSNEHSPVDEQEQLKQASNQSANFLSMLQANSASSMIPAQATGAVDGANTWIPKFVWIGDIKNNDELKCFAAFLIGSLSNPNDPNSSPTSPGVFMTPFAAQSSASSNLTQTDLKAENTTNRSENLIAKASESSMTPPMPKSSRFYTEFQMGVGFLYFTQISGNLAPYPTQYFGLTRPRTPTRFPVRGPIEYNRTPIFTADFGFRIFNWMYLSATFQSQQNISVRTRPFQYYFLFDPAGAATVSFVQSMFTSQLCLYSVGGKVTFVIPSTLNFKTWCANLFLAGSAGAGWQSWTQVNGEYLYSAGQVTNSSTQLVSSQLDFRSKTFPNFSYTGDAGFIFRPTNPLSKTAFRVGCKFIGWGSARGLGDSEDQANMTLVRTPEASGGDASALELGYFKPLRIDFIYSWAPYFGFIWDF